MDSTVVVAIIGAIATVITAAIASYQVARRNSTNIIEKLADVQTDWQKEFADLDKRYTVSAYKIDILWEIYAEEAIRKAKDAGMLAARSPLRPTKNWDDIMPYDLGAEIKQDANEYAQHFHSPYDITVELWGKHKAELLKVADSANIPIKVLFGVLHALAKNALEKLENRGI